MCSYSQTYPHRWRERSTNLYEAWATSLACVERRGAFHYAIMFIIKWIESPSEVLPTRADCPTLALLALPAIMVCGRLPPPKTAPTVFPKSSLTALGTFKGRLHQELHQIYICSLAATIVKRNLAILPCISPEQSRRSSRRTSEQV